VRIVLLGSGQFAVPSLEALARARLDVLSVVTQPDRPSGRGRSLAPTPVKTAARALGLEVSQPERIRAPEATEALRALAPDLLVVVAYGQILPPAVIAIPRLGTVNVHASLLPSYRGAAPIQWAIARGETETGVTTMLVDEGLDTGPLLLATKTPIGPEETAGELEARLAILGADLLLRTVQGLGGGTLNATPQPQGPAPRAPLVRKQDGRIEWTLDALDVARRVRAFNPWPVAFGHWQGCALRILRARREDVQVAAQPGEIVSADRQGLLVACGAGTVLRVIEVQPESRRPMTAEAFLGGARLTVGARLS
jgi:methionyl-tRNA formyltransferase